MGLGVAKLAFSRDPIAQSQDKYTISGQPIKSSGGGGSA